MPFPESPKSKLIPALVTYLEAASAPYKEVGRDGEITWDWDSDTHTADLQPKGLVYITRTLIPAQSSDGTFFEDVRIRLRLVMSERADRTTVQAATTFEGKREIYRQMRGLLEQKLIDAEQFLVNDALYRLSQGSLSINFQGQNRVIFAGLRLIEAPQPFFTQLGQDGGVTGALILNVSWMDGGGLGRDQRRAAEL